MDRCLGISPNPISAVAVTILTSSINTMVLGPMPLSQDRGKNSWTLNGQDHLANEVDSKV